MNYQEAKQILQQQDAAKAVLEQYKKLEAAHEEYGFKTRGEFIKALQELESKNGKRARLTPADRKAIESAIGSGKPASKIAKEFGISIPYVYTLKRGLKTGSSRQGKKK